MTSFGWKRKIGEKISRTASAAFQADAEEDEDEIDDGQIDWLTLAPKRKFGGGNLLEDAVCKSDRLREEGNTLCEAERYWEAIKKWDEAIQLTPSNEVLFELKAQVLLLLQEVFPAVQFAEKATKLKPNWWSAYQTLGRALLGLGEVKLAVRAFSKAVHLNPTVKELWKEDLQWACTLLEQKKHITAELEESTLPNSATIKELDTENRIEDVEGYREDSVSQDKESDDENNDTLADEKYSNYRQERMVDYQNSNQSLASETETVKTEKLSPIHQTSQMKKTVKSMPTNYVMMRMSHFLMAENTEQRICIKFCQKLGKSGSETFEMLKDAYGYDAMSRARIFDWHRRFKEGRTSVESDERPGRPSTSRNAERVDRVHSLMKVDRRLTIRELCDEVGISFGSCQSILTEDLGMRRVAAKFVPQLLTPEQKESRMITAIDLLQYVEKDTDFLKTIITGDESWVYGYDPEIKSQSSGWKSPLSSPRPKKTGQVWSKTKVLLTVFFDKDGVVHHEYAPEGQTVTKQYYLEVLCHLLDAVRCKRPDMWSTGQWQIHHDNAPAHSAQHVQQFLAKHRIVQVQHPPCSPDLAPCDFFLFPKLKIHLKGKRFEDVEDIKRNTTAQLHTISKEEFQRCFDQWKIRWNKCVEYQGDYFEEN